MAEQYNLRCFILPGGEKPVPIKIPSIRTVAALAYEIYPKTVGRFDLSSLRLYRVDATGVNEAIEKMRTLRLAEDKLDSLESLNTMYPSGPPEDKIHIVVQLPLEGEISSLEPSHGCYLAFPLTAATSRLRGGNR
jgi:hypothetical protein